MRRLTRPNRRLCHEHTLTLNEESTMPKEQTQAEFMQDLDCAIDDLMGPILADFSAKVDALEDLVSESEAERAIRIARRYQDSIAEGAD